MERKEIGAGRGTAAATQLGGIPLFLLFLLLLLILGKIFRGSYLGVDEYIPSPTASLHLFQLKRDGLLHT